MGKILTAQGISMGVLALIAVPIAVIDLKTQRIPDILSLGGIALLGLIQILVPGGNFFRYSVHLLVGFGAFWLILFFSKGKMGLGDVKYSSLIAGGLGIYQWLLSLFFASVAGTIVALVGLMLGKVQKESKIPFGPFLSFGVWIVFILFIFQHVIRVLG